MKKWVTIALVISWVEGVSQNFEKEFEEFKSEQASTFQEELRMQDSVFASQIQENWRTFRLASYEKEEEGPDPKPIKQPENPDSLINSNYKINEIQPRKLRSFDPPKYNEIEHYPEEDRVVSADFHGQPIALAFPSDFLTDKEVRVDKSFVSEFWLDMNKRPFQKVINSLLEMKGELNIPGYGYYLLISDIVQKMGIERNLNVFYTWFLMLKSGYDVRVGFDQQNVVLILSSNVKIYNTMYFSEGSKNYYVLSPNAVEVRSYGEVYIQNTNPVDFVISSAMTFPLNTAERTLSFDHLGDNHQVTIQYEKNTVSFLERFPQTEISSYFNSKGSLLLERSLIEELKPRIESLTESEKIAFLLSFVQKAFDYKTDKVQFGEEKVMFPDQILYYPYSDCDDRTVFLSYLIGLLTNTRSIAVVFPQHVALAVKLSQPTYGETIEYKGIRFVLCDPTFYNAPLGALIPSANRSKMKVISY